MNFKLLRGLMMSLGILLAGQLNAQTNKGSIKGIVKDANNQMVPYAVVQLKGRSIGTTADGNGSFKFTGIPAGEQIVKASFVGYSFQEKTVIVRANETVTVDFTLEESNSQLNEVIVSASRRTESLAETPSSVTVIGSKEIEAQSAISPNIANIIAYAVPGLGASTNQTGNFGQTLRGRNVLVLIDGIPQSTPLRAGSRDIRTIDPTVIERVEVIKGATAIYGNGADGGLINYITKTPKPGATFGGYTQAGLTGNFKGDSTIGYRFSQQVFGRSGKLDYVVSGMYEKTGVYRDSEGQVISPDYGLGETKTYNGFAKLGYNLSEKQRLELMYNYFSSNQHSAFVLKNGIWGKQAAIGILGERKGVDEGNRYNHNAYLQYSNKGIIGNTSLTASVYLQDFWTTYSNSLSFYESGQSEIVSTKKGLRANLNSPFVVNNNFTGDVTYGFDLLNDVTAQNLVDGRVWVPKIDMRNLAPYFQLSTNLYKHLTVKAGMRLENININIKDYNTLATGPNNAGSIAVKGGDLNYNALVFNTGVRYSKHRFFNPFISYSQSFSVFDLGRVLRAAKENTISKLETEPIIVNNYEGGFSSELGKFTLSAAYYLSTSKLGSNLLEVNGTYVPQRLPERVWGYEIQLDYQPIKHLIIGGNYAFVEGKGDADNDGNFDGSADVYLNSTRITPPKATAYLRYFGIKNLSVDLNWIYVGDRDRFKPRANGTYAIGEAPIRSYNLWNLAAGYKINSQLKLNLGIENLLNTEYYPTIAQFYGTNENYTRGNGRRFNLTLGYAF